jgi:hypothetical protein
LYGLIIYSEKKRAKIYSSATLNFSGETATMHWQTFLVGGVRLATLPPVPLYNATGIKHV